MSECANCDVHRFIACKNGLLPGGCHKNEISGLYSAEPERAPRQDSLASSGEFVGVDGRRASTYDDAAKRVQDLQKKIQDLREQDDTRRLVEAGEEYFELEAEVNQYLKLKSAIAKAKELLKPRSVGETFLQAARSAGAERPFLALLLEKQFEIWNHAMEPIKIRKTVMEQLDAEQLKTWNNVAE